MIFKTEYDPKLLFVDDLPKTIKESETNKVGQSSAQRYQPTLKWEKFTNTMKPFLLKSWGASKEGGPGKMFNHIHLTNKGNQSNGSTRTLFCQTISN